VDGIVFNANANAFRVTARARFVLTISGVGITNNSGTVQNFVTAVSTTGRQSEIQFTNGATAGNLTVFTNNDNPVSGLGGSVTQFFGTSSAGNATFVNKSGTNGSGSGGGGMTFNDASTAGFGTFINTSPLPGNGPPFIFFNNSSTAGTGTFTNGGLLAFGDTSTAGNGTFMNNGASTAGAFNGQISIGNTATAGNGTFVSKGGEENGAQGGFIDCGNGGNGTFIIEGGSVSGASGASVEFFQGFPTGSTAGDGIFTINGGAGSGANGGTAIFHRSNFFGEKPTADNATLIASGGLAGGAAGSILFLNDSSGGHARVEVFDNGFLDISGHEAPGVSVGSIEGSGLVFLGALNLKLGNDHRDTEFSGLIQDGGIFGGSGGSLTKIGTGTLVLRNSSAYTGGTTIIWGKLEVNNESGSGTGSGPVQVNAGRLGGRGIIAGDVTLGDGSGLGAILSPGKSADTRGTLIIESMLAFNSDGTYKFELNSHTRNGDEVIANGVTINSGAQFSFADVGNGMLPHGLVFTAINNTSPTPIAGTFGNLPDGSTFTSNGNTYQVSYEGGDGNDLTLTVQ